MENVNKRSSSLANIIAYALIGAISFVVMKFEIPIMPGVGFLKFDFSDVIITIGMFIFGAVPGIFIALIRSLLSLIFSGFNPMSIVGQLAAFLASISFAIPFYVLSKNITKTNRKTLKGYLMPIFGLVLGIVAMTAILSLLNAFILTPMYALFSVPNLPSIGSYGALMNFTEKVYLGQFLHLPSLNAYIFGIIVPFNLLKGVINSIVVYLLFEATLKNIKPFVRRRFNINN
ncbi:ECF transporter S component [Lactobacillus sp. LL6]|uniref:ECF transporter S component n=1 Tax=Lactobacillus sp. LL6 TaxID=2596827 RepID=UPI001186005F|nr:ECF transporter S component [Lactobacillus sp. LL6]TSO26258.1 ECF transporter S component [Lactobacillus sp. LL6]